MASPHLNVDACARTLYLSNDQVRSNVAGSNSGVNIVTWQFPKAMQRLSIGICHQMSHMSATRSLALMTILATHFGLANKVCDNLTSQAGQLLAFTSIYMITDLEQLVASVMQVCACMAVTTLECNGACRVIQVNHQNKCCVNVEQHNSYWLAIQH